MLITGGAGGIGIGMARAFAEAGARIALLDIDDAAMDSALYSLSHEGVNVHGIVVDLCDADAVIEAVNSATEYFGGLHVVCANAGVTGHLGPLQNASTSDWNWIIDVNLKGTVHTIQATLPHLLAAQGERHIVLTSSISGLRVHNPSRGQGMYNTTKFAIVGFGEALALDLADDGIGVSIVCPGVVKTDLSNSARNRQERYGGAVTTQSDDFVLAKQALSGTDPLEFGRWVRKAVEEERLIVVTHPADADQVAHRHERIMKAFADSDSLTGK